MTGISENPCAYVEPVFFRDLQAYAERTAKDSGPDVVAITRSRARCAVLNPDAEPSDLALLIVMDKDRQVIGYWGFMPGRVRVNGRLLKVSFSSTGFIKKELRRSGVTQTAFAHVKKYIKILCATGNSPDADRMYRFLGVTEAAGFNAWALSTMRMRPLRRLKTMFRRHGRPEGEHVRTMLAPAFPSCTAWLAGKRYRLADHGDRLPDSCAELLARSEGDGHVRSPERIRWMLAHPWWPPEPALSPAEQRYHFAWMGKQIRFRVFELTEARTNETRACIVLSEVHDPSSRIKLLDYAFADQRLCRLGPVLALELALRQGTDEVWLPPALCSGRLWSAACAVFGRKQIATYFTYAPEAEEARAIVNLPHRLTDGDTPFW